MALPAPPLPTTYGALCTDPAITTSWTNDVGKNKLRSIYSNWSTTPDGGTLPLNAEELIDEVTLDMSLGFNGGILVFVSSTAHPEGTARVLHGLRKHARRDEHRGDYFAYVGDVHGQDIETSKFDVDLLSVGDATRVQTNLDDHINSFAADPTLLQAPQPAANAGGSRSKDTRGSMFVPSLLLPMLLGNNVVTPRMALLGLTDMIRTHGIQAECEVLLQFLTLATTKVGPAVDDHPDCIQAPLGSFGGTIVTSSRREEVLYQDLPVLRPQTGTRDPTLHGLLGAMRDVRDGVLQDMQDRREDRSTKKATKTIAEKWNERTVDRLCKMCAVVSAEDLPPLYHELAGHKQGDGTARSVLQDAVEAAAGHLGVPHVPVMTTQHSTSLNGWVFYGPSIQSLGEGLLPFSVIPPNQVSATAVAAIQAAHHQNMDYNTVMTGSTSITSGDASKLRTAKGYIPANFEEMIVQVTAYTAVLGALLGVNHPNVTEHKAAVDALVQEQALLKSFVTASHGSKLGAATVTYYFQVRHRKWFQDQWRATATLPAPKLVEGFDTFAHTYTTHWLPKTDHVDLLQRLSRPIAIVTDDKSSQGSGGISGTGSQKGGSGKGGGNNGESEGKKERKRVSNRNRDARVMGETPLARKIRKEDVGAPLRRMNNVPPSTSSGKTRCLSWHLKGKCFDDCPRKDDHIVLPTEDADNLVEWCTKAYP